MVLVGCKCDLTAQREVTTMDGETLAARWGCPFLEVSAKTRINIDEMFYTMVREIRSEKYNVW